MIAPAAADVDVVVVELGERRIGLRAADVDTIERAVSVTPLPSAPAIVEGIISVRGVVVAVLDLRRRFGIPAKAVEPSDHLVLATVGDRRVAVRVDRALELRSLERRAIQDAPVARAGAQPIANVARLDDGLLLVHDLQAFLTDAEAAELDGALAAAP